MKKSLTIIAALALCAATSFGALTVVEDFEGMSLGSVNGQGNFTANANTSDIVDSGWSNVVVEDGDKCLKLTNRDQGGETDTVYTALYLGTDTITDQGTVYLRYKADSANDCMMALNDLLPGFGSAGATAMESGYQGAATYSSMAPLVRLGGDQNFRARDDSSYLEDGALSADTWYEMWMLVDATNDRCQYYMAADDGMSVPMVVTNPNTSDVWWGFRNDSYDQLSNIKWFMGVGDGEEHNVYVDTIAVDNSAFTLDCVADVPEPATLSLLVLGGLGLVRRRR